MKISIPFSTAVIDDPSRFLQITDIGDRGINAYVSARMREQSIFRRVMPPIAIPNHTTPAHLEPSDPNNLLDRIGRAQPRTDNAD